MFLFLYFKDFGASFFFFHSNSFTIPSFWDALEEPLYQWLHSSASFGMFFICFYLEFCYTFPTGSQPIFYIPCLVGVRGHHRRKRYPYISYLHFIKILGLKNYRLRETFAAACAPMPTAWSATDLWIWLLHGSHSPRWVTLWKWRRWNAGRILCLPIPKKVVVLNQLTLHHLQQCHLRNLPLLSFLQPPKQSIRTTWGLRQQVHKYDHFVVVVVALYAASNRSDYFQLLVLLNRYIPSFVLLPFERFPLRPSNFEQWQRL